MLDTIRITLSSTSNRQSITPLPTTSNQSITVPTVGQQSDFNLKHFLEFFRVSEYQKMLASETYQTMLASENILRKEWDTPEENKAWEAL